MLGGGGGQVMISLHMDSYNLSGGFQSVASLDEDHLVQVCLLFCLSAMLFLVSRFHDLIGLLGTPTVLRRLMVLFYFS